MKLTVVPASSKDRKFDDKMELLLAFMEHSGLLVGGGWNTKNKTSEWWIEPHNCKSPSCKQVRIKRITKTTIENIIDWCDKHRLLVQWKKR